MKETVMQHALCVCVCVCVCMCVCVCVCVSTYLSPFHIFRRQRVMHWNVIGYFLHEPLEALASMFLPDKTLSQQAAKPANLVLF